MDMQIYFNQGSPSAESLPELIREVSGMEFGSVDACIESLGRFDYCFRREAKEKVKFADLSQAMKENMYRLIDLSCPAVAFDIDEQWQRMRITFDADGVMHYTPSKYTYRLRIADTAESIAGQVDEFLGTAVKAFSDPLLNKGVTPNTILRDLVDRYIQEEGVDEPEEIKRIVDRMVKRLFATNAPQPATSTGAAEDVGCGISIPVAAESSNIGACMGVLREASLSARGYISRECAERGIGDPEAVAALAKWAPRTYPSVRAIKQLPAVQDDSVADRTRFTIDEPHIAYRVSFGEKDLASKINPYVDVLASVMVDPLLRTSTLAVKAAIEDIPNQPAQDISLPLQLVIEGNFHVRLIKINSETDRYATPVYFDVSRANVPAVVTTRPAVVDTINHRVLQKGLYLRPLEDDNNEHKQYKFKSL